MFVGGLFIIIPGFCKENFENQMSVQEIISASFGFLIVISLCILGLKVGINNLRKDRQFKPINYDKKLDIELNGKISYIDYRNLVLGLSFKKPVFYLLIGIVLLLSLTMLPSIAKGNNYVNLFLSALFLIGFLLIYPALAIKQIKTQYKTNKILNETLSYHLTNESIQIVGSSINSTQNWSRFYQIKETKNFFMLYHSESIATLLDKKIFSDEELNEFREFIKSLNVRLV